MGRLCRSDYGFATLELRGKDSELDPAVDRDTAIERIADRLEDLTERLTERDRELAAMRVELAHREARNTAMAEKLSATFSQVAIQRRRADRAEAALARITGSRLYRPARALYLGLRRAAIVAGTPFRTLAAKLRRG